VGGPIPPVAPVAEQTVPPDTADAADLARSLVGPFLRRRVDTGRATSFLGNAPLSANLAPSC
jgi:hypothetical protein